MGMFKKTLHKRAGTGTMRRAQTAIEYLLLFGLTAIIVFVAFQHLLPQIHDTAGSFYNAAGEGIAGDPPPVFPPVLIDIECKAYPVEWPNPGTFATCDDPTYPYEFAHYTSGEVKCSPNLWPDAAANVTICCNVDFPDVRVITSPKLCKIIVGSGPPYQFYSWSDVPQCSPPYGHEIFSWLSEEDVGDADEDDAYARFCIAEEDAAEWDLGFTVLSVRDNWGSNPDDFPSCTDAGGLFAQWCEGNCDGDDAKNVICYGGT